MPHPRHHPRHHARRLPARLTALAAVALLAAAALAGCGRENDSTARDETPSESPSAPATTATPGATDDPSGTAGAYPTFAPEDYVYRVEVLCYCPQVGQIRISVVDGEVVSAKNVDGPAKGADAPDFARLTINDIIARANDPMVAKAEVTWPDGQAWPSAVALDQIENAVDDEVTYTINAVQVR